MISPIPLYLDKFDVSKLIGILHGILSEMTADDCVIISQDQNLDKVFVSIWSDGLQINQYDI